MRLKKLDLVGFKSFVDATSVEFSPGISGIVGPNGCGKSNIVDALRWVLGEQSASRLRGDAMEDVIFNGNQHRGPTGMAEVSLLLDNDDPASVENPSDIFQSIRDQSEILVTRRYFRSGESEYLINRRPCRLKDITELFLGTGVGSKAYAIVEQGRVNQLVEAKAEDLRLFIEEAAGTTLYRSRRLAAERKMERTEENLRSVSGVLSEIDKQIGFLRRMAKKAEQFKLLADELRTVELGLGRRVFDRMSGEIATISARRDELRAREAALEQAIAEIDARREDGRQRLAVADVEFRRRQEAFYALRAERERADARLEMLDREERESGERLGRIDKEREALAAKRGEAVEEADAARAALAEGETRRTEGEAALAVENEAVAEEAREVTRLAAELERVKSEIVECLRVEAEMRNLVVAAERGIGEREERRARLRTEVEELERSCETAIVGADALARDRGSLGGRIVEARSELQAVAAEVERLLALRGELDAASIALAGSLAEAESRLSASEEVERGYGRYQEGVQAVMRRHGAEPNGIVNLVAEVLEAPAEYEKAVAAVLGDRLQSVIVRTPEDARDAIGELKEGEAGRSSFLPLRPRAHAGEEGPDRADGIVANLLDVVRVEEGFGELARALLEDAVVVRDLDAGIALWKANGRERTIVTPEGEVIHPNGMMSGGSAAPAEERLLSQRREIRRLREEVARLVDDSTRLEDRRRATAAAAEAADRRRQSIEESLRAWSLEDLTLAKDAERLGERIGRDRAELERRRRELERLDPEIAALATDRENATTRGEATLLRRSAEEESRAALADAVAAARARHEARVRGAADLRVVLAGDREKEEAARQRLRRVERELADLDRRLEELQSETAALGLRGRERGDERAAQAELAERTRGEEATHEADYESRKRALEALAAELDAAERALAERRNELESVRRERSAQEIAATERELQLEAAVSRLRELYQVEIATHPADEAGDEAALRARVEELRPRLDRMDRSAMGAEAASELAELEARRVEIVAQKEDLERAIEDLRRTIAGLNRESRDRFLSTFEAVDAQFQQIFPKLFRGGRARLLLTDAENLLETGVDIQCQPPGMNVRTLSLLSGGQKALTAVSLIFSLFLCKPSPFCVLDEVDAPLDDANIDRFNQMVREMGSASQFLIITHNKRTMEVADTLYGVTMEEPGVSKVVSVRFDRAA